VLLLQRGQIGVINHRLQNVVFSQVWLVRAKDIHVKWLVRAKDIHVKSS
jgi:hypothetical protein